jgi:hypothetical protein
MRRVLSTDEQSGTTRFQVEAPAQSYLELLQADDFEVKHCPVKSAEPMAQVSWTTADRLSNASDLAFQIEARRRGYIRAGKILSGTHHDSGKKKHKRWKHKSQKRGKEHAV